MTQEEFEQKMSNIDKKLDRIIRYQTIILKALHLVTVTEKEEMEIALARRKNAAVMQKVEDEIAAREAPTESTTNASIAYAAIMEEAQADIYDGIIGDDFDLKR